MSRLGVTGKRRKSAEAGDRARPQLRSGVVAARMGRVFEVDHEQQARHRANEEGRQCAERALQLSPQLADAHALLQIVFVQADQDWAAAESEGRKALALDPSNPEVLFGAGWFASIQGRYEEGERMYRKALDRDPLNFNLVDGIAENYYRTGRLADAENILRAHIERERRSAWSRAMLSRVLLVLGKPDAALAMLQEEVDEGARIAYLPIMLQGLAGRPRPMRR